LRCSPDYSAGHITTQKPADIAPLPHLRRACAGCPELLLCGGRCIYASESMRWGKEGFALVCQSVRHLLSELRRNAKAFEQAMRQHNLPLSSLDHIGFDYEVIP
jgi:hypothetical protein